MDEPHELDERRVGRRSLSTIGREIEMSEILNNKVAITLLIEDLDVKTVELHALRREVAHLRADHEQLLVVRTQLDATSRSMLAAAIGGLLAGGAFDAMRDANGWTVWAAVFGLGVVLMGLPFVPASWRGRDGGR